MLTRAPEAPASSPLRRPAQPRAISGQARTHVLYLATALLLPLLAVPLLIAFGRSDIFLHHGASLWVRANDQVFATRDRPCDTLLFGDSTAMTGLDPERIAHQSGGPVCNIAMTNAVLAVTGDLALDRFLDRNPRPRTLLIQLSPESFSTRAHPWEQTVYAEGMLEMLRWSDPHTVRHTLLTHPRESLAFAGYTAGFAIFYAIKQTWERLTGSRLGEDAVTVRNGFFTAPLPPLTACTYGTSPPESGDRSAAAALIQHLQQRYRGRVDHLLITVSPIPDCDPDLASLRAELDGLTVNPLTPLPVGLFNDQRHFTAVGAALLSDRAATQIQDQRSPPRTSPKQSPPANRRPAP